MITCPKCGELNGETRETCWKCGESLNNPQGVERRVMCSQCSSVYTTSARYCPRCGGLLRPFSGSAEDARLIRNQREEEATRPHPALIVLCCLLPGFALRNAHVVWLDERQREWFRIFGLLITPVHLIILIVLSIILRSLA